MKKCEDCAVYPKITKSVLGRLRKWTLQRFLLYNHAHMGEISQKRVKSNIFCILGMATLFLASPFRANAYIDLGLAGSFFQAVYLIIIAALAFIVSPILFFWKRIVQGLGRLLRRKRRDAKSGSTSFPAD